jgi:hypothetical protein
MRLSTCCLLEFRFQVEATPATNSEPSADEFV